MMLVEAGLLDLHEPVVRWLPEAPPPWRAITLHHLLSHGSGVSHWSDAAQLDPAAPASRDDRLAQALRAPLQFEPGTRFRYSSPGFLVVGVIAERASGTDYPRLLAERIVRPLGLGSTTSGVRPTDAVPGHRDGEPVEAWDLASMIGTGDVWSTAEDFLRYARALADGVLVSPASLALMRTEHAAFPAPDRGYGGRLEVTGYGYGHYLGTFDGRPAALHTGDNPGYKSIVAWLPDDVTVVGLSNEETVDWESVVTTLLSYPDAAG